MDVETVPIDDAATYIEPASAPSNYRDPDKIRAYVAEKEAEQVNKCSLDPDLCRIACIGWDRDGHGNPFLFPCRNEEVERASLTSFWANVEHGTVLVGFNLLNFDIRVLLRRSLYLDVKAPDIQIERFKHPQIDDLMLRLCWGDPYKAHSLAFYVQRFGLPAVEDDVTGADIGALVKAGEWDRVANHCCADVLRTLHLARRLGVIPAKLAEAVAF